MYVSFLIPSTYKDTSHTGLPLEIGTRGYDFNI